VKNLHHGDAMSFLRDKRERYDVVFLVDILSYLSKEEIRDLLDTVSGVLKPGGTLIVKNANAESPMAGRLQHADFKREVNFTESSLKNVLRNVGFKKVGAYPLRPVVHGVKSFVRYCLWRFVEGILKFYRLIETGSPHGVFTQSIIVVANK